MKSWTQFLCQVYTHYACKINVRGSLTRIETFLCSSSNLEFTCISILNQPKRLSWIWVKTFNEPWRVLMLDDLASYSQTFKIKCSVSLGTSNMQTGEYQIWLFVQLMTLFFLKIWTQNDMIKSVLKSWSFEFRFSRVLFWNLWTRHLPITGMSRRPGPSSSKPD